MSSRWWVAVSFALAACANAGSPRLRGTWVGSSVGNFSLPELPAATAWAKGLQVRFDAREMTIRLTGELPRYGAYQVAAQQDNSIIVDIKKPHGALERMSLMFVEPDKMRWDLGDGRYVTLLRAD